MKKIICIYIIFLSFNSFSQEIFEYEFDENISINVIEDSDEGEINDGKFIKGTYKDEIVIYSKSDKGKEQLKNIDDNGLVSFFKGLKDGTLKSTNGVFISENEFTLDNVKIYSFRYSFKLKGKEKLVENYVFIYKDSTYTIQFMADKDKFENNNEFRQSIIDSIKFN